MGRRNAIKKTGYNVNTMQEIMFRGGGRSLSSGGGGTAGTMYQDFATADYIADVTVPEANYRVDFAHLLGSSVYIWTVIKLDDNRAILPMDYWQGDDTLILWFASDAKDIRIIISP